MNLDGLAANAQVGVGTREAAALQRVAHVGKSLVHLALDVAGCPLHVRPLLPRPRDPSTANLLTLSVGQDATASATAY